jgi:hypothetical protein
MLVSTLLPRHGLAGLACAVAVGLVLHVGHGTTRAQTAAPFATLTPSPISITQNDPVTLAVALAAKPAAAKSRVFLEAVGVKFDRCFLEFSDTNYATAQSVTFYPDTSVVEGTTTGTLGLRLLGYSSPTSLVNLTQAVDYTRTIEGSKICSATGDPHYTTFDGTVWHYQGKSVYYLVSSSSLVIQSRHGPWASNPSAAVHVGLAIAYGKTVWVLDALQTDANLRLQQLSANSDGVTVSRGTNDASFTFSMSDGAVVRVTTSSLQNAPLATGAVNPAYLNVYVTLPPTYRNKAKGLCGAFNGDPANDLTKGDPAGTVLTGTTQTVWNEFGASWAVADADNIFLAGAAAGVVGSLTARPPLQTCVFPATMAESGVEPPPPQETYYTGKQARVQMSSLPTNIAAVTECKNPSFQNKVRERCRKAMQIPGIEKVRAIPLKLQDDFVEDCVQDCALCSCIDPVERYREAYQAQVTIYLQELLHTIQLAAKVGKGKPNGADDVISLAEVAGFGNFKCPQDCHGHGDCRIFGCTCKTGWGGHQCDQDLSTVNIKCSG